jgi:tripartite-type tricarboxylate transporter receptor subunit TctC
LTGHASAQTYPAKSIRIVAATAAGGGVDTISRIVGQKLAERWSQSVVVENRPGAGGAVGSDVVAKSSADGHTLLTISISYSVIPSSHKNLPYDPVRDLVPVTVLVNAPNILVVHPSLPAKSIKELVSLAKARPGELYYASSGNGSPAHLATELLKLLTGTNLVHVPYKGTSPGMIDVTAGRVSMMFASVISTASHIKAGKLRVLATAGTKRAAAMPNVPTIAEAGVPGYAVDVWYAMLAPAATPRDVLVKLNGEVATALHLPEIKDRLAGIGLEPVGGSLEQSAAYIQSEVAKWAKVVKAANIAAN